MPLIWRLTFGPRPHHIRARAPIRALVLAELSKLQRGEVMSAWEVAKRIDALGSTVSSRMFKMATPPGATIFKRPGPRTYAGKSGSPWLYHLPWK